VARAKSGEIWLVDSTYPWKGCIILVWKNLGDGVVIGEVLDMEIYIDEVMKMQPTMLPEELWRFYKNEFVCKVVNKRKERRDEKK